MVNRDQVTRAEGHTFKCTRWYNASEILSSIENMFNDSEGFDDNPSNYDRDPKFKITIIVEEV